LDIETGESILTFMEEVRSESIEEGIMNGQEENVSLQFITFLLSLKAAVLTEGTRDTTVFRDVTPFCHSMF
jgi:hypothetical protein